jgi:4-hydroxy-3-methylbut-2-enyl diphosphate reductase
LKIVLSDTLSYCVGVRNTIQLVTRLLAEHPSQAYYMLGELVHNEHVIDGLKARGLGIVHSLDEVEPGGIVILQSHGTPRQRYDELHARGLEYVDATCPMVKVIHRHIREVEAGGLTPVVVGQAQHEEVRGIAGQVGSAIIVGSPEEVTRERFAGVSRAGVVVQSTFVRADAEHVVERIRGLVPEVVFHDTICQPTKQRQREIMESAGSADCVIVIGSKRSANTLHLYRLARAANPDSHLIDEPAGVEEIQIPDQATVFIASGASTPEELILDVVRRLKERDAGKPADGAGSEGQSQPPGNQSRLSP